MFKFVSHDATRDMCGGVELGQLSGALWRDFVALDNERV